MRWTGILPALSIVAALLAGCGGEQPLTVRVQIHYSRFTPERLSVPLGRPVTFLLENRDPIAHEWIVGDSALHDRHRSGREAQHVRQPTEVSIGPLETASTSVTFSEPGQLAFVCHLPGHEAYGMVGTLEISGS